MKNLFIDMDGVLAEYRKGCNENDLAKKGYFASLKPEENMLKALEMLIENSENYGYRVCVLTKVYPTMFKFSPSEKQQWRDTYMPYLFDSEFIMVNGEEEEKSEAIKNILDIDIDSDCILIDDYNNNLMEWQQNGGTSIKFVNEINDQNHSFLGNRITYSTPAIDIFNSILSLLNLTAPKAA